MVDNVCRDVAEQDCQQVMMIMMTGYKDGIAVMDNNNEIIMGNNGDKNNHNDDDDDDQVVEEQCSTTYEDSCQTVEEQVLTSFLYLISAMQDILCLRYSDKSQYCSRQMKCYI